MIKINNNNYGPSRKSILVEDKSMHVKVKIE